MCGIVLTLTLYRIFTLKMHVTQAAPSQTSALTRVPPEILSEVFLISIEDRLPVYGERDCPLYLTKVCRLWRAIAISTPLLWARLQFSIDCEDKDQTSRKLHAFSLYLQRSQEAPLTYTLELILSPSSINQDVDLFRPFIELLLQHAHHWSDVIIQNCSLETMEPFSVPTTQSFPLLRRLSLLGFNPRSFALPLSAVQAPLLDSVVLPSWSLASNRVFP